MFHKSKGWISGSGGGVFKPKNPHSLEHLKYLYGILCKNQTVTDQNLSLLVETLRSISEILIWGDQNDSSVFDFFLEKNMLVFFLKFMRQKTAQCICVQLLQTLNILFDNITNETSVYYLLSNNHINSIIIHKFDFSDEEVMAYYISFLKTLSMKLNKHTIHFFYNEHTNDFALYTEAIKFFNHGESMVRIAVRTITLNVYRACVPLSRTDESSEHCAEDKSMLQYIKEKTAAPYFSNLVKFIGQHVLELNTCVKHDIDHNNKCKLADLVAEHLDHLHYLNDILCLEIDILNETLTEHLLNSLFIPLYIDSLLQPTSSSLQVHSHVDQVVSLFLLSQVFLIIHHVPLVRELADIIFMRDNQEDSKTSRVLQWTESCEPHFGSELSKAESKMSYDETNSTDEEKLLRSGSSLAIASIIQNTNELNNPAKPYLSTIFLALDCTKDDYKTLLALCLLYALGHNKGVNMNNLSMLSSHSTAEEAKENYNSVLIQQFINIMSLACQSGSKVRLATLELCALFVKSIAWKDEQCILQDGHLAAIEGVREEATLLLRNFYKSEEIFLDMFEDEHRELTTRPLNVEHLMMDASILLSPIGTPLTGIDFCKRLPCGEVERARRAIRLFFIVRGLSFTLRQEMETALPLTKESECVKINDVLDLNNSDLIACTVVHNENKKERRFLVIDVIQLILVEPDSKRLGWGIVRFSGFLQDTEVMGDKDDSRCLLVTIHRPPSSSLSRPIPILSSKFIFDDHIRCMAARQRLTKGRLKARQRKMQMIARMLDMPSQLVESIYVGPASSDIGRLEIGRPSSTSHSSSFHPGQAQRRRAFKESEGKNLLLGKLINATILDNTANPNFRSPVQAPTSIKQSIFASVDQVPGFNLVATEQEHDKRSRKLKAKLADSIAKHQAVKSAPVCADELPISCFSVSPQSGVESKKKMFLSMAKEAKQRSLQQGSQHSSLASSDQTLLQISLQSSNEPRESRATDRLANKCRRDNLKKISNNEITNQLESSSLPILIPQPSPLTWSDKSTNTGSLDSKLEHFGPSLVSRLRIRAHSESAERSIGKSEESRSSGSMLPKNVFISLMSPLTKKSSKQEFPLELKDATFSESLKTEENSSNAENIV